jgi:hypothetical protein
MLSAFALDHTFAAVLASAGLIAEDAIFAVIPFLITGFQLKLAGLSPADWLARKPSTLPCLVRMAVTASYVTF